jgi:hypothetical protein
MFFRGEFQPFCSAAVWKTSASVCERQIKPAANLSGSRHSRCEVARLAAKQAHWLRSASAMTALRLSALQQFRTMRGLPRAA